MTVLENVSLKAYNTFGLNTKAAYFISIGTIKDLHAILKREFVQKKAMILGGGSNLLLTRDFDGAVIKMDICGKEVIAEDDDKVLIKVGAGENWHEFVLYCLDNDWGGVENLSLIPGTVGAAPMQNIGAYGVEIQHVFDHLTAVNKTTLETRRFNKDECKFGYRESVFKNIHKDEYVITHVVFKLTKRHHTINTSYGAIEDVLKQRNIKSPGIREVSEAVVSIRQSKLPDPEEIGNAGSFFKNPTIDKIDFEGLKAEFPSIPGYEISDQMVKIPAAWLIENCGWKGYTRNHIGVHKNQALVLVNYGNGTGSDLKMLASEIQDSVASKFGIELSPEVNII
ncbi:UDP-N-acetylmuramate dehydrogenase [Fulvivirga sp. M361]|uniref:UDP-N-acetylmuramate dehydrogenase n=1 Tax=Fulvivirga sp. M361 TaxID=2594266 RepID=UPI00117BADD2|nr:UDP-N-acetylmuramate dehydrogenase [Fulvivirga sp. M361]TRX60845.1 UDP-N-acetylmuramate dehydrogenase [Fulvivirga sp. M361]